ncbi:AEC family transporter [Nesterenkonia ebinurensis]|uniref:AEC family transporter n=1 Tax=Nesterenkonia ebinurensis TaxID=2608252 RepID=UPI00123E2B7B|nr:AEC family transporter [Nesterenkonia ebinurensis]
MVEMLTVIAPLFAIILLGFGAGFAPRILAASGHLNAFVFYFALPCFIYTAIISAPPVGHFPWVMPLIVLVVTPALAIGLYCLCRALGGLSRDLAAPVSLAGSFGNVGYFGIPISIGVLGPEAGLTAGVVHMVHNIFFMNGYPLVRTAVRTRELEGAAASFGELWRRQLWPILRRGLVLNPVFWFMGLSLLVVLTPLSMPQLFDEPVAMLGTTAVPLALFCVGLALHPALQGVRSGAVPVLPIGFGTAAKLLILPAATWLAVLPFSDQLGPVWAGTLIILAATPSSTTAFIFSETYDGDGRMAAAVLVATTAVSLLTLPLVAAVLL